MALMEEQGFTDSAPAGVLAGRPRLLGRQTVVVGASDGVVLPAAAAAVPRVRLAHSLPMPTDQLLSSFRWVGSLFFCEIAAGQLAEGGRFRSCWPLSKL